MKRRTPLHWLAKQLESIQPLKKEKGQLVAKEGLASGVIERDRLRRERLNNPSEA